MERITRLSNVVGTQYRTGYPRFNRWDFNKRVTNIESRFISSVCISLVFVLLVL